MLCAHVSPSAAGPNTLKGVPVETVSEDVHMLLLCEDGSHGLDLSFVTHIFLLDILKDPALLKQVPCIARHCLLACHCLPAAFGLLSVLW